jgi:hypothetical protein
VKGLSSERGYPRSRRRTDALRAIILRLGRRLGLDPQEIAAVAESECGRTWPTLGQGDLLVVLDTLGETAASCRAARRRA